MRQAPPPSGAPPAAFASQLVRLVLGISLPLMLLAAALAGWSANAVRTETLRGMAETVRVLQGAVDGELRATAAALEALATSPETAAALATRSSTPAGAAALSAFRDRAGEIVRRNPGALVGITLAEPDGTGLVSSVRPLDARLPNVAAVSGPDGALRAEIAARWAEILAGDDAGPVGFVRGAVVEREIVAIGAPVRRNGELLGGILAAMPLDAFARVLRSVAAPPGWATAVIDQHGLAVAREPPVPDFVGRPVPAEVRTFQQGPGIEGSVETVRGDGTAVHVAMARTKSAPWLVAFSAPRTLVDAPVRSTVALAAVGGAFAAALAAAAALILGRRLQLDLSGLAATASRIAAPDAQDPAAAPIRAPRTAEVAAAHAAFDRAGAAIAARERERRELLATLDLGAAMARDPDSTVRYWSKGCERLYGWTAAEAVGRHTHELLRTVFPVPFSEIEAALDRDGEWSGELRHRTRSGREVVVAARKVLRRDAAGRPVAVVESLADVTVERQAEAALRETTARLRLTGEAAGVGFFACDLAAGAARWDATAYRLQGLTAAGDPEPTGFDGIHPECVHPEDRDWLDAKRAAIAADPAAGRFAFDVRIRRADTGETRWIASRGEIERDPGTGRPVGSLGVHYDVTDRAEAQEHLHLMVDELNHRVKNTLATVQSIAMQTLSGVDPAARDALEDRLLALAAAHDVLTREEWSGAAMDEIAAGVLAPLGGVDGDRIAVSGPPLRLAPRAALSLSLGLHELATNALKYGALSRKPGRVDLQWKILADADPRLLIVWTERGGPPASPPQRRGFGMRLVERTLAHDLGGTAAMDFAPAGITCTIEAPLARVAAATEAVPLPRLGRLARG